MAISPEGVRPERRSEHLAPRRTEIALGDVDPLAWLDTWAPGDRVYWASRDGTVEIAGVGVADALHGGPEVVQQAAHRLRGAGPRARYFGRFHFGRGVAEAGRFVLPRVEVGRDAAGAWLAMYDGTDAWPQMAAPVPTEVPTIEGRVDTPDRRAWQRAVEAARAAIAAGGLRKVVLARHSDLQLSARAQPLRLLERLCAGDPVTFRFLIEDADGAFVGATPERLYARHGRRVLSEGLAGTRPRGATLDHDRALADALLASTKDRHEHALVVDAVQRVLETACEQLQAPRAPSVQQHGHVQHLHTPIAGRLRDDVDDSWLIRELHPTPAVCGAPQRAATETLAALEPFQRGPYAAPLGWVGADAAEFAVALRCVEVRGKQARLWTGAGIVAASDAAAEWAELDAKLAGGIGALGGTP